MRKARRKIRTWGKRLAASAAIGGLAVGALAVGGATVAQAAGDVGLYYAAGSISNGDSWGANERNLGPIAQWPITGGKWVYCIESGQNINPSVENSWQPVQASDTNSRIAAQLASENNDNTDNTVQAAVAYAIHDHLDIAQSMWGEMKNQPLAQGGTPVSAVSGLAAQLWNKAAADVPANATVEQAYVQAKRTGTISVFVKNAAGGYTSGVPFTIQGTGPVTFSQTSGVTVAGGPTIVNWTATGNGHVTVTPIYYVTEGMKLIAAGTQTGFAPGNTDPMTGQGVAFQVIKDFQPTVTSQVPDSRIEQGQVPLDTITSGIKDGDTWQDSIPVKYEGTLYGPFTSAADAQTEASLTDAKAVATSSHTFTGPGQKFALAAADVQLNAAGKADAVNGQPDGLPTGYYHWSWKIVKADQGQYVENITGDYLDPASSASETAFNLKAMQPEVSSNVDDAYGAQSATVTGIDGQARPATQYAADTDTLYVEKGQPIKDDVTLNVADMNGDGVVDTKDWLHTTAGRGEGKESVDNQITITLKGTLYGTLDQADAAAAKAAAAKGVVDVPKTAKALATATVTTNKAGTYTVSSDTADNPAGTVKAASGVDLSNLPTGAATWVWTINNADQSTVKAETGIAPSKDYPFVKDTTDGFFAAHETMFTRLTPSLNSTVSLKQVQPGGTTTDKLVVNPTNAGDLWPTFPQIDVTEGERASNDPIPVKFVGNLYAVGDDTVTESTDVPAKYADKIVHTAVIDNVTKFGEYTTDSYTLTDPGKYVWVWEMQPDLKGSSKLNDIAWRELTHAAVKHDFGMAAETVIVPTAATPKCSVTTKSQGQVSMDGGSADLTDQASLDCAAAAQTEFELWKQGTDGQGSDVLITVTPKVDSAGKTEVTSPKVTVHDTGTYYWRERTFDTKGQVVSYGAPRVSSETVTVTGPGASAHTGGSLVDTTMSWVVLLLALGSAGTAAAAGTVQLRRRRLAHKEH